MRNPIIIVLMALLLQGCVNAAVTGAQVIYDRHKIEKNVQDQCITLKAYKKINKDTTDFQTSHIDISTFNRVVLISGQVPTLKLRIEAEHLIKEIPGVKQVHNLLTVCTPCSTLTSVSDTWITAKIKSKFIASKEVDPSQIKVVTENGTVYLIGTTLPSQANAAVYLARTTDGVQNVVKVFRYLKYCDNN